MKYVLNTSNIIVQIVRPIGYTLSGGNGKISWQFRLMAAKFGATHAPYVSESLTQF